MCGVCVCLRMCEHAAMAASLLSTSLLNKTFTVSVSFNWKNEDYDKIIE